MGLPGGFGQIVLGDDDMGSPTRGARERFERISPTRFLAQIDAAQKFSHSFTILPQLGLPALFAALLLNRKPVGQTRLRSFGNALVHVIRHSLLNLDKFVRIVNRTDRPLQRMASHAVPQRAILFLSAGYAL